MSIKRRPRDLVAQLADSLIAPIDTVLRPTHPKLSDPTVDPIFVVGMERSGTTLVYSLLTNHPELLWLSRLDNLMPRGPWTTSTIRRLASSSRAQSRHHLAVSGAIARSSGGLLAPSEGIRYWSRHLRFGFWTEDAHHDDVRTHADVGSVDAEALALDLRIRSEALGRSRLLAKVPGFVLMTRLLESLFGGCTFVVVIRDPMSNLASLANAKNRSVQERFWGTKIPGWEDLVSASPVDQALAQLEYVYAFVSRELAKPANADSRIVTVRYEDIVENPISEVNRMTQACQLTPATDISLAARSIVRDNRTRARLDLTVEQTNRILALEHSLGY